MTLSHAFRGSLLVSALLISAAGCGASSKSGYTGGGYAPPGSPAMESAPKAAAGDSAGRAVAEEAGDRPGLGTQWGETRDSRISSVPFERGDGPKPFTTSTVFYNDAEGARAMAGASGFARTAGGLYPVANGALQIGLKDENGSWLSGFTSGGRSYVIGEAGGRYTIVVRNATPFRIECVLSVDGLDVLDGKDASFSKRGYIVDPRGEIEVDGFRTSTTQVAAFRFGSVRGSYAAQKHDDTRNVGVIGLAAFHERGTEPWKWNETQKRHDANPFPGQYATPPGVAQ